MDTKGPWSSTADPGFANEWGIPLIGPENTFNVCAQTYVALAHYRLQVTSKPIGALTMTLEQTNRNRPF